MKHKDLLTLVDIYFHTKKNKNIKLNKIEGLALKMIKKRRSLFEHGKLLN